MNKFMPGDKVKFRRHNGAGGAHFGRYLEVVTIRHQVAQKLWSIARSGEYEGPKTSNAYEEDLIMVEEAPIPGDDDPDCV